VPGDEFNNKVIQDCFIDNSPGHELGFFLDVFNKDYGKLISYNRNCGEYRELCKVV
jgi:hypothetical protein